MISGVWLYLAWIGAIGLILIGLVGLFVGLSMLRKEDLADFGNDLGRQPLDAPQPKDVEPGSRPVAEFDTFLVGHREANEDGTDRQQIIASLSPGDELKLRHEPRRLDPNAVAVVAPQGVVGFFPAKLASDFLDALADPTSAKVTVNRIVQDDVNGTSVLGVWVHVELSGVPDVASWWQRDGQGVPLLEERKSEEIPTEAL